MFIKNKYYNYARTSKFNRNWATRILNEKKENTVDEVFKFYL